MRSALLLSVLLFGTGLIAGEVSLYDQARELYKVGPSKGTEVVRLLREHIKTHPKDIEAVSFLGITLFGIEKPDEALSAFDRAIQLADEKHEIRPWMLMFKARTFFELHRYNECRHILDVFWAFWQGDPELKKLYDWYYPRVFNLGDEKVAKQPPQTPDNITAAPGAPVVHGCAPISPATSPELKLADGSAQITDDYSASTLANTRPAPAGMWETELPCLAEVKEIKKEHWLVCFYPISATEGDYTLTLKLRSPEEFAEKDCKLNVRDEKEMMISGVLLSPGDIIGFRAAPSVLKGDLYPNLFSGIHSLSIKRNLPNKLPLQTPTSGTPAAGAPVAPAIGRASS